MSLVLAERGQGIPELLDDDFAAAPRFIHRTDPGGLPEVSSATPFGMRLMEEHRDVYTISIDETVAGFYKSKTIYWYSCYHYCGD